MAHSPDQFRVFGTSAPLGRSSGNAAALISVVFWAAGFPAAGVLLEHWDTLFVLTARLGVVLALMLPIWSSIEGSNAIFETPWLKGIVIGGVGFGSATYLLLYAQYLTDPVTVAIVVSATPIGATLIEVIFDGRKVERQFFVGLMAAIIGGVIASGGGAVPNFGLGALLAFVAGILFSIASRSAIKHLPNQSALGRMVVTFTGALIFVGVAFLISFAFGNSSLPMVMPSAHLWTMLLIYGILSMAVSQVFFLSAVERIGIALTSFYINLAPFFVMIIMLILGASWSWPQAIGAVVIIGGVLVAQGVLNSGQFRLGNNWEKTSR